MKLHLCFPLLLGSRANIGLKLSFLGFVLLKTDLGCSFYGTYDNKTECRVTRLSQSMRVSTILSLMNLIFFGGTCNKDINWSRFPISGLYFVENGQKCIFYVILWVYGPLEGPCEVLYGSQPTFCIPDHQGLLAYSVLSKYCHVIIIGGIDVAINRAEMDSLRVLT